MPEKRRAAFADPLLPDFHERDAVMDDQSTLEEWQKLKACTLVVSDAATRGF